MGCTVAIDASYSGPWLRIASYRWVTGCDVPRSRVLICRTDGSAVSPCILRRAQGQVRRRSAADRRDQGTVWCRGAEFGCAGLIGWSGGTVEQPRRPIDEVARA